MTANERHFGSLARFVHESSLRNCGATRVVLIDGRSGAGKTHFAEMFADALGEATTVHMDDLYPGWDGLEAGIEYAVRDVLLPLSIARPARYHRWDWEHERWGEEVDIGVPETLIVEGTGACAEAARSFSVLTFQIFAPEADRFRRAIERDGEAYRENWDRWKAQEDAYFRREDLTDEKAMLIDGMRDWDAPPSANDF